jgi:hypothetical protein
MVRYVLTGHSQLTMAISIQKKASEMHDDIKVSISVSWLVTDDDRLNRKRAWNVCVPLRRPTTRLFSKTRA